MTPIEAAILSSIPLVITLTALFKQHKLANKYLDFATAQEKEANKARIELITERSLKTKWLRETANLAEDIVKLNQMLGAVRNENLELCEEIGELKQQSLNFPPPITLEMTSELIEEDV